MHVHCFWSNLLSITIGVAALVQSSTESGIEPTPGIEGLFFDEFMSAYWAKGGWKGASSWTGDVLSRLTVSYLS